MAQDPASRFAPEDAFVVAIDELLEKSKPDNTIPWSLSKAPSWAAGFRPRSILDLGAGVGGFAHSVLLALGRWGCLQKLEQVVLVESSSDLLPGGPTKLKEHLGNKIGNALPASVKSSVDNQVILRSVEISANSAIELLEPYPPFDLIIASHITYYFEDGLGPALLNPLSKHYLCSTGLIWCVIRIHNCPIYETRTRVLAEQLSPDAKPFDYAEAFEATGLAMCPNLVLRAKADKGYLEDPTYNKRGEAAHWLMWREPPPSGDPDNLYWRAAQDLEPVAGALFKERHFVLGKKDDG